MLDTLAYLAQRLDNDPALFTDPVIETTWIWAVKDALALFNHLSEKGEHQSNLWGRKRDVRAWMYIPQYAQEKLAEGTFSLHRLQADITVIGDLLDHELHHNVVVTLGMNMRTLSDKLNKTRGRVLDNTLITPSPKTISCKRMPKTLIGTCKKWVDKRHEAGIMEV